MEHEIGEILSFEDFNQKTIYKNRFKNKVIKVIECPNDVELDRYHTLCELTCVLCKTCICDKCKCLSWQRRDKKNIVYVFIDEK